MQVWTFAPDGNGASEIVSAASRVASAAGVPAHIDTIFTRRSTAVSASTPGMVEVSQYAGIMLVSALPHAVSGSSCLSIAYNLALPANVVRYVETALYMAASYRGASSAPSREARSQTPHAAVFGSMLYHYFSTHYATASPSVRAAAGVLYDDELANNQYNRPVIMERFDSRQISNLSCGACGRALFGAAFTVAGATFCAPCASSACFAGASVASKQKVQIGRAEIEAEVASRMKLMKPN